MCGFSCFCCVFVFSLLPYFKEAHLKILQNKTFFSQETVRELEGEINRLEKEKANLNVALNNAKTEHTDG